MGAKLTARQRELLPATIAAAADPAAERHAWHRDIVAGQAAGMGTLAAAWGYLGQGEPVHAWGADGVLSSPAELLQWLELA